MLTGDDYGVAVHIAGGCGIKEFWAGLLPEQKLNHIKELQKSGHKVAMIGDGINDAPSLAAADIGIAMGAMGTDVAMEAADIALMGDDLAKLPYLLQLGKSTVKTINFNIAFAVIFNLLALLASGAGLLSPVMGAITHNVGSVLVVLNSARLIKFSPEKREIAAGAVASGVMVKSWQHSGG
jgi:Cd2+/Zn2+-exporting ATPase